MKTRELKTYRQLERIAKGFSNHRRLAMLELLQASPELSLSEISERLRMNFKTASEHLRRLVFAGLILKRSDGKSIRHALTKRASNVLTFLRTLE